MLAANIYLLTLTKTDLLPVETTPNRAATGAAQC